jgi:cytochrome c
MLDSFIRLASKSVNKIIIFYGLILLTGSSFGQAQSNKLPSSFEVCSTCHSLNADENGTGPTLYKLIGRKAGSVEGFRYSGPLKRSQLIWDQQALTEFLSNPQGKIPGNRMPYSGLSEETELKELVDFLLQTTR